MLRSKLRLAVWSLLITVFLTSGLSCKLIPQTSVAPELEKQITLEYWGVWEDRDDLNPVIADFQTLHPNIKVNYTKFRYTEYEQKLLEAWADDRGPDIYSIPAGWLKKYQSRITVQPATVRLPFQEVTKTMGKTEVKTVVSPVSIYSTSDIKNQFADVVYNDVVINNQIYGLPVSVDTLALFYNRALLDAAGIATPPTTWEDIAIATKKISLLNADNNFVRSGIALGTGANISNSADILSLLMMQNGSAMADARGNVSFGSVQDRNTSPAMDALRFYTDFADPIKEVYSWNNSQPNSLDAFIAGRVAMIFGYAYHLPTIKGRAPKLDFGVSPMPQITSGTRAINYSNYWITTVSHKAVNSEVAWGFINFLTMPTEAEKYLTAARLPSALRSLIGSQADDPEIGIFASQVLTAKRWYRGADSTKMENIFNQLITDFPNSLKPAELLQRAASQIAQSW
jgi:multiple sugar transport system substrate-binding protein